MINRGKSYVAKPIKVEAIQWLGNNGQEVSSFYGGTVYYVPHSCCIMLSGKLLVVPGNYIVRYNNEYYVYQAQQFQERYKLLEE